MKQKHDSKKKIGLGYVLKSTGVLLTSAIVITLSLAVNNMFLTIRDQIFDFKNVIIIDICYILFLMGLIIFFLFTYSKYVDRIDPLALISP